MQLFDALKCHDFGSLKILLVNYMMMNECIHVY